MEQQNWPWRFFFFCLCNNSDHNSILIYLLSVKHFVRYQYNFVWYFSWLKAKYNYLNRDKSCIGTRFLINSMWLLLNSLIVRNLWFVISFPFETSPSIHKIQLKIHELTLKYLLTKLALWHFNCSLILNAAVIYTFRNVCSLLL